METISIEKMTYGVDSLGHLNGKVVFIPYGAPNDEVEIEIKETKSDYLRADLKTILKASPQRQKNPCTHFPDCGGCHWLHLHPETQRREKEAYLHYLLKPLSPANIYPIEPLSMYGYRNKMELKLAIHEDGTFSLGNYRYRSYDVIDIPDCVVQCEPNKKLYASLKIFLKDKRKLLRNFQLRCLKWELKLQVLAISHTQHRLL